MSDPMTVKLVDSDYTFHAPNTHVEHSSGRDVLDVVAGAALGFLTYIIAVLVMA